MLDPGRGRTKRGYFWAIARDDRPWGGADPPAVAYTYAPGRGAGHARALLGRYRGIVQCDGYAAYKRLADPQPLACGVAAVSVGVVDGRVRLDLPYDEDSRAEVDMNVVATDAGTLVEVQGTGEGATYTRATLDAMLDSALAGCARISEIQAAALAEPYPGELP